jgi:hypothetical protein
LLNYVPHAAYSMNVGCQVFWARRVDPEQVMFCAIEKDSVALKVLFSFCFQLLLFLLPFLMFFFLHFPVLSLFSSVLLYSYG